MSFLRVFFFSLLFFLCNIVPQSARAYQGDFFSPSRFTLDTDAIDRMAGQDRARKELDVFVSDFTAGMMAFSGGDLAAAETAFLKARGAWPEYFGTDFMLALVHEKRGDNPMAARFYKSYLNKLRDFYSGRYPMSEALIQDISPGPVERYDEAQELVKDHLGRYGIDLDMVQPVITFPSYLLTVLMAAAAAGIYLAFLYLAWPYVKRQRRLNNPPEGFWICRHCLAANPDLSKVCQKCRRPREK